MIEATGNFWHHPRWPIRMAETDWYHGAPHVNNDPAEPARRERATPRPNAEPVPQLPIAGADAKPWWRSETVNASLGAAGGGLLTIVMVLNGQAESELLFPAVLSVLGAVGAIHGRMRAQQPIQPSVSGKPKPGA